MGADFVGIVFTADRKKWDKFGQMSKNEIRSLLTQYWDYSLVYNDQKLHDNFRVEELIETMEAEAPDVVRIEGATFVDSDRKFLMDAVADAMHGLANAGNGRDSGLWVGKRKYMFVTGGMSYGDDPTESFSEIALAGDYSIFVPGFFKSQEIDFGLDELLD